MLAGLLDGSPLIVYGLDGALVSAVASDGRIVTNEIVVAPSGRVMVSDMLVFDGSVMLTGTEYALDNETSALRMWTSTDGLTWSDVGPSGLEPSAHMTALTATDEAAFSAGYLQESPAQPTLTPAMWRSTDGRQWEAMTVPDLGPGAIIADLFAAGDTLIMFVAGGTARALHSTDGGDTWVDSAVGLDALAWSVNHVAGDGDMVAAAGSAFAEKSRPLVLVSSDAGASWNEQTDAIPIDSDVVVPDVRLSRTSTAFWLATAEFSGGFSNPESCYQDLSTCQGGATAVLFRSADARTWEEVDLTAPAIARIDAVIGYPDGGVMVVGSTSGSARVEAWIWTSDTAPPAAQPTSTTDEGPPIVRFDSALTIGSTYRFPLYIHCGMGLLGNFNDRWWYLVGGTTGWGSGTGESGPPPANWPIAEQYIFGTITLTDEDTIEYTIPSGETIATYEASDVAPELCA